MQPGADQVVGRSVDGFACGFPVADAHRRPRRAGRRRHERRAAADRARLPGPPDRARPVRLRVGDEVADRDRADDVRRVRPLLAAAGLGAAGADQADEPHRHAAWPGQGPRRHACRSPAWRGPRRSASAPSRSTSTTPAGSRPSSPTAPTNDTWRQWVYRWDATPGRHSLRVRATDRNGAIQTDERAEPIPDGASGHHQIVVIVE